jgi:hypothetical protein
MATRTKLIRTIYLYVAALVSLIFVAVGSGTILNTVLKSYVFPKAEKGGYNRCNQQFPTMPIDKSDLSETNDPEKKAQIESIINDYEQWKKENTGEECYSAERQSNFVDSLTMLVIALLICLFHWRSIKKDKEEKPARIAMQSVAGGESENNIEK